MERKVLITGAAGFIGGRLANFFISKGFDVVGIDRFGSNNGFTIQELDLLNTAEIKDFLISSNPSIVIHCAGAADVSKSVVNPEMDFEGNVTITHNLLFAMHKCQMEDKRFVFLSSAGVYGNPSSLPITEDFALKPMSPYAVHKVMCEELCKYFINNYKANIKIARIFSAYGSGLKKQLFWDMHSKIKNTGKLEMFGTGNESRDYIHIDDVVKSIFLIATQDSEYDVFNVANGEEVTIRCAAECFAKYNNIPKDKLTFNGIIREGDPLNWKADIQRITSLGYEKTINIDDGIRDYSEWCNNQ